MMKFQMSINIIQKAFTTNRKESVSRHDTSPVKTVLGKPTVCDTIWMK